MTKWLLAIFMGAILAGPVQGGESAQQVDKLAAKYSVPAEEIAALRQKGMGWGEIGHALAISQKAGAPLADVVKLRDSGMGWGAICGKYGFKLGDVARKSKEMGPREGGRGERGPRHERGGREWHGGHGGGRR
jgi:hypothetical protein